MPHSAAVTKPLRITIYTFHITISFPERQKAIANAGAATQRHLVNRGSSGLLPVRPHVLVLVATTRCVSDNKLSWLPRGKAALRGRAREADERSFPVLSKIT